MAIQSTPESKLTLSHIYQFLTYSIPFLPWHQERLPELHHNLYLNDCFKKVSRNEDDPEKGY
jgi:forkhead box protein I